MDNLSNILIAFTNENYKLEKSNHFKLKKYRLTDSFIFFMELEEK
jgi:hypothetical protein